MTTEPRKLPVHWSVPVAIGLAVLFWAVGAYNRLSGHRDRLVARFEEAERLLQTRRRTVLAWVQDSRVPGLSTTEPLEDAVAEAPPASASMPVRDEVCDRVADACAQAAAAAASVRRRPTRGRRMASLNMAEQVLERTLREFMAEPGALATPRAQRRRAAWVAAEVQLNVARHVFNREVRAYNRAVTQFPARLVAWAAGLHPTVVLQAGAELSAALGRDERGDRAGAAGGVR